MLHYVDTYEDARQLIMDSVDMEPTRHNIGVYKYRMLQAVTIMLLTSIGAAIWTRMPFMFICLLPSVAIAAWFGYVPYRNYVKVCDSIRDGSFLDGKSEAEAIEIANQFVDTYNATIDKLQDEDDRWWIPPLVKHVRKRLDGLRGR